jgi:GNAT superfamily N-acetyltransferase
MNFRPFDFSDADYQAYVNVANAAHPEAPQSAENIRYFDETRGKDELSCCFLVEMNAQVIGWVEYRTPRNPQPGSLELRYRVLPGQEFLTQPLWDFALDELRVQKPQKLVVREREDWKETAFFLSQGFAEYDRMWASSLDVSTFSPEPFQHFVERSKQAGLTLHTLADFPHTELEFRKRWYTLIAELLQDVPSTKPTTPWSFETWLTRTPSNPRLLPEGYFFALDGDEFVGLTELAKSNRPKTLHTGLTGVTQNYRRKGIAQTLKLKAVEFTKNYGAQFIRTNNHVINRPMLSINEAMGFVKEPAWVNLKKEMTW